MDFMDMNRSLSDESPKKEQVTAIEKTDVPVDLISKAAAEVGIVIPADKAIALRQFLKVARYGHQATLSMKCKAEKCAFIDSCPLKAIGAPLPVKKQCPVENALLEQWVSQFVDSLELDRDEPCNAVEMHMVYELAGMELIRRRAAHELSEKPELIKTEIVGYSPHGEPIYDDKPSQALLILERYSKIVNKLRDSLLATPKAQSQAGQVSKDLSTRTANIMQRTKDIIEKRQQSKKPQDAEFKVISNERQEQEQSERPDSQN